jgi:hypothetical protein
VSSYVFTGKRKEVCWGVGRLRELLERVYPVTSAVYMFLKFN